MVSNACSVLAERLENRCSALVLYIEIKIPFPSAVAAFQVIFALSCDFCGLSRFLLRDRNRDHASKNEKRVTGHSSEQAFWLSCCPCSKLLRGSCLHWHNQGFEPRVCYEIGTSPFRRLISLGGRHWNGRDLEIGRPIDRTFGPPLGAIVLPISAPTRPGVQIRCHMARREMTDRLHHSCRSSVLCTPL